MRSPTAILLAASLALNLAGLWWCIPSIPSSDSSSSAAPASAPDHPADASHPHSDPNDSAPATDPTSWENLVADLGNTATDDATLLARLRAARFSTDVIRAIFAQRIADRFLDREVALVQSQPQLEYWNFNDTSSIRGTAEVRRELRRLQREQRALLDDLLGSDAETPAELNDRERQFGPLPRETSERLADLLAGYRDLEAEVRANSATTPLPSDRDERKLIAEARDRDIAELLTPEQLVAYQRRADETSNRLRSKLTAFEPSEAEFLAIYALQSEFDAKWGTSTSALTSEQRRESSTDQQAINARIAETLGPERYAEYEEKTSSDFYVARQLTDRLELPVENASAATRLTRELRDSSRAIAADKTLSLAAKAAQNAALQRRARTELATLLTDQGLSAYESSVFGRWIGFLAPSASTASPGGN